MSKLIFRNSRWLSFVMAFLLLVSSPSMRILADQDMEGDEPVGLSMGLSVGISGISAFAEQFPVTAYCSKDTFVVGTGSTDYSQGNERWNLLLSNNMSKRSSVFEFDMTGVGADAVDEMGSAVLEFEVKSFTLAQGAYVRAYAMDDDIWPNDVDAGSGMTGAVAARHTGEAIQDAYVLVGGTGKYSIDVTEYVRGKYGSGIRKINFLLKVDPTTDAYGTVIINSRDNGKNLGAKIILSRDEVEKPQPIPVMPVVYYCAKDTFVVGTNDTDYSVGDNMWNLFLSNNVSKRAIILEFDLQSATPEAIGQMTNAKLTVDARSYSLESPTYLRAYAMEDSIWPNDTDTGSGMTGLIASRGMGAAIPGAWTYVDSLGSYELDVTEYISEKYEAGSRKINIALKIDPTVGSTNGSVNVYARNTDPVRSARIRVGYEEDAPEPPKLPKDDIIVPVSKDTHVIRDNADYSSGQSVVLSNRPQNSSGVFELDLSEIPAEVFDGVKTVTLLTEAKSYSLSNPAYLRAYEMPDDIWPKKDADAGSGLTGEYAIPLIGARIPGARAYVKKAGMIELDITGYVKDKYDKGQYKINMALALDSSDGSVELVSLNQDRTRAARARLRFTDPPEATTVSYVNSKNTYVVGTGNMDYSTSANYWNIMVSNNLTKRAAVFEFDLSGLRGDAIEEMVNGSLVFELKAFGMAAPVTVRAYGLPDDIWPRNQATNCGLTGAVLAAKYPPYSSAAATGSAITGSEVVVGGLGLYKMDITEYIIDKYESGSRKLNIMLMADYDPSNTANSFNIIPKVENKSRCARISITTTSPPPPTGIYPLEIPDGLDTDTLTTTRHNDWLVNLHLTSPAQIKAGYHGGEGWQMIWTMAVSPTNTDHLIFGTDSTGIFKSENNGYDWRPSNNNYGTIAALSAEFDPEDEKIIYVVGGSLAADSAANKLTSTGLYRSMNGGASWTLVKQFKMVRHLNTELIAFAYDAGGKRAIFVGTQYDGLLRSDDGQTFYKVTDLPDLGAINGIHASGSFVYLASEGGGIWASEDCGRTWSSKNAGLPASDGKINSPSVTINPIDHNHWVSVANNGLYASYDAGNSWSLISAAESVKSGSPNAWMHRVMFSPQAFGSKPYLYLVTTKLGYPLRVSDDYGQTWFRPDYDTSLGYVTKNIGYYTEGIAQDPHDPNNMWWSHNGEVYRSYDGGRSFKASNSGYSGAGVASVLFNPDDEQDIVVGAIDFGISQAIPLSQLPSTQKGKYPIFNYITSRSTADYLLNPPVSDSSFEGYKSTHGIVRDPANYQHLFISVGDWYRSCLMETTDGGLNWKTRTGIINDASKNMAMAYHKDDPKYIYAGQYYSDDNGVTWKKRQYTVNAISPKNNDLVFSRSGARIYISYDRGKTWSQITQKFDFQESYFFDGAQVLTPDIEDETILWVGRWGVAPVKVQLNPQTNRVVNYVEYGTRHGFLPDNTGLVVMWSIAQDPRNPKHLIAGGVNHYNMVPNPCFFESYDKGESWHPVYGLEGSRDVLFVKFHPTLPQVWLCTSSGLWIYEYENYREGTTPPDPDGSGGGGGSGSSGGGTSIPDSQVPLAPGDKTTFWYEVSDIRPLAAEARETRSAYVKTSRDSLAGIRKSALNEMSGLTYMHDTMKGKSVQVRVTIFNPAAATSDILLTGYVSGSAVDKTKALFEKWFANRIAVVSLAQLMDFGQPVEIAAKLNLSGMNTSNLYFYAYNPVANAYRAIPSPNAWVDANGYLHFMTGYGGDIVISDTPLTRK